MIWAIPILRLTAARPLAYYKFYAEKLGEYKDVEGSLPEAERMLLKGKVGFMSRTLEWVRVDKIPAH
jgi:hypothetical protein